MAHETIYVGTVGETPFAASCLKPGYECVLFSNDPAFAVIGNGPHARAFFEEYQKTKNPQKGPQRLMQEFLHSYGGGKMLALLLPEPIPISYAGISSGGRIIADSVLPKIGSFAKISDSGIEYNKHGHPSLRSLLNELYKTDLVAHSLRYVHGNWRLRKHKK